MQPDLRPSVRSLREMPVSLTTLADAPSSISRSDRPDGGRGASKSASLGGQVTPSLSATPPLVRRVALSCGSPPLVARPVYRQRSVRADIPDGPGGRAAAPIRVFRPKRKDGTAHRLSLAGSTGLRTFAQGGFPMSRPQSLASRLVDKAMTLQGVAEEAARADDGMIDAEERTIIDGLRDLTRHLILLDFARTAGRSFEDSAELTAEMEPLLTNWQRRNLRELRDYLRPDSDDDPDDDGAREAA